MFISFIFSQSLKKLFLIEVTLFGIVISLKLEQLEKQAKTNQLNVITEEILKGRFNERQSIKIMPPAQKVYA